MIQILIQDFGLDGQGGIFLTGWGNGASMAYRLACELFQKSGGNRLGGVVAFEGMLLHKDYSKSNCKGILTELEDDFEVYEYSHKLCNYDMWKKLPSYFQCTMRK